MGLKFIFKDKVGKLGFKGIVESLDEMDADMHEQMKALGNEAKDKMISIINDGKVRPQAGEPTTLEDNITIEHTAEGWGLGKISQLNAKAKHWAATNWGSAHMVGKWMPSGIFSPGNPAPSKADFRKGRFKAGGPEPHMVKVTKPIPAKNYIEKTVNFVRRQINNLKLRK